MRKTARILLRKKWLKAAFITLVAAVTVAVPLSAQLVFLPKGIGLLLSVLISVFVVKPMLLGYKRWCAGLRPDSKAKITELFYFFTTAERYFRGVFTGILVFVRILFVAVFSMLPPALCFALADWLKQQPQTAITVIFTNNCILLGIIATVVFSILFVLLTVKNIAVPYFVAADDSLSLRQAVRMSTLFVREKGGYILRTLLLLFPLCIFIIPIFAVVPYFVTVCVQSAKKFIEI